MDVKNPRKSQWANKLPYASVSKRVFTAKTFRMKITLIYIKVIDMNGFAQRLVLTQRQKTTRKWLLYHLIISQGTVAQINHVRCAGK